MAVDTSQLRGVSLLIGGMYALDVFSSYMSSPWSTEAFAGNSEERAQSARRLVALSITTGLVAGGTASILDKNPWPLVGAGATAAVMFILYEQALARAAQSGGAESQ